MYVASFSFVLPWEGCRGVISPSTPPLQTQVLSEWGFHIVWHQPLHRFLPRLLAAIERYHFRVECVLPEDDSYGRCIYGPRHRKVYPPPPPPSPPLPPLLSLLIWEGRGALPPFSPFCCRPLIILFHILYTPYSAIIGLWPVWGLLTPIILGVVGIGSLMVFHFLPTM
jgi:hypothetical protein